LISVENRTIASIAAACSRCFCRLSTLAAHCVLAARGTLLLGCLLR